MKLGEAMYAEMQAKEGAQTGAAKEPEQADVVDAEFTEVKKDGK
jgi:hypothetical protein